MGKERQKKTSPWLHRHKELFALHTYFRQVNISRAVATYTPRYTIGEPAVFFFYLAHTISREEYIIPRWCAKRLSLLFFPISSGHIHIHEISGLSSPALISFSTSRCLWDRRLQFFEGTTIFKRSEPRGRWGSDLVIHLGRGWGTGFLNEADRSAL